MSYLLNGIPSTKPLSVIPNPAEIIYLMEYGYQTRVAQVRPCPVGTAGDYNQFNHFFYHGLHTKGANYLFSDGHAKWQRKTATTLKQFGANTSALANPDQPLQDDTNGCNAASCSQNVTWFKAAF
jgi:prepilin-type processing-associated H-X9-DG protein